MKILHLSDLHIGKSVNGFSMIEEQRRAFEQIVGYIGSERPAAVVIAGDVYDRAVPGVEAVQVFDDFLTELAGLDAAVMLISGNHDSPERLSYASRLLAERQLYFYGVFDGEMDKHKVTLSDEHGEVNFWLLPFVKPASVRGMFEGRSIEEYGDAVAAVLEASGIDYAARNVLVSHQFYTKAGVDPVRSESELNPVGGLDAVDAGIIERFDYVALGHLHRAQSVGAAHIRYCGSPIKYSLSEWRHEKSVTLVELGEKGSVSIKELPITPVHDMREIKGPFERLISDEVSGAADRDDYLRVVLTDEDEVIDAMSRLRTVYPNIMNLSYENSRTGIDADTITVDVEKIETLSPYDLFSEFFLQASGAAMNERQAKIIREILETEAVA